MTNPEHIFVSIKYCTRLQELGLTTNTWAKWRQYSHEDIQLVAPGFDSEGFYQEIDLPEGLRVSYIDTPAYTLQDMLQCVPGFRIWIDGPLYVVNAYKAYNLTGYSSTRLPDAAAQMVEQIIRDLILHVDTLNESLSPNTIY